jgi:hypothetical protein
MNSSNIRVFAMFRSIAVCLLLPTAVSSAAADVKLEWKFKEGETFYAENVTKTKQAVGAGALPAGVEKTTTAVAKYKVIKTTPEGTVLEMQFAGIKSDGKDLGSALGSAFGNNLKDVAFRITLNKSGKVTKFEGIDEYMKKIVGDNEAALKAARAMGMEELFSQGVTQTFGFLPEKGVSKGDKWKLTGKLPLPLFGSFKTETEYVYQGAGEKGEQISLTQQLTYEVPKVQEGTLLRIIKGDMKCEPGKGQILFDATTGKLVRLETAFKFKGTFTTESLGKEQTINMEQESTVVTRLLSENPLK